LSHHLDSPEAQQDPRLDISDVYVFAGAGGTVFVMNVNPLSGANGFHPEAQYEFKIDTDGDAVEDRTLRVTFDFPEADGRQSVELRLLEGPSARDRHAEGTLLISGSTEEELTGPDGIRMWAGAAADPFYIEGTVVTAVRTTVLNGTPLALDDFDYSSATNAFRDTNVCSIVVEVPNASLPTSQPFGFWGVTALATDDGGWRQINRCAQPLMNTLFTADDSELADAYNAGHPSTDHEEHGPLVSKLVSQAVRVMGTVHEPDEYARQVQDALFPDVLRYQAGTPGHFGHAVRNGRGLTENSPEVMFCLVLNKAIPTGLSSADATGSLRSDFPYVAPPVPAD
jgi:hypothetical protein